MCVSFVEADSQVVIYIFVEERRINLCTILLWGVGGGWVGMGDNMRCMRVVVAAAQFDSLVLSVVSAINHDSSLSRMISYFKRKFRRGWISWLVFYSDLVHHIPCLYYRIIFDAGVNSNQLFFAPFVVGGFYMYVCMYI